MSGTLVDANVILDVLTEDLEWLDWSIGALERAIEAGPVYVNPVIYAEVSVRFSTIEGLEEALPVDQFRRLAVPWEAAFLAGKAFVRYRRSGGSRLAPLPDFFIGAHAAVAGLDLLTRDAGRFRTYFPSVPIVAPS